MEFEEIQKAAFATAKGSISAPLYDSDFDDTAFWKLENVYTRYLAGEMSMDDSKAYCVKVKTFWKIDKHYHATALRTAQMYKDLELAVSEYRKNHTLDNADRSMEILYGFFNYIESDNVSDAPADDAQAENEQLAVSVDGQ